MHPLICLITTIILLLVPSLDVTEIKIPCVTLSSNGSIPIRKEVLKKLHFRQS
jgi:hypothetical protein